MRVKLVNPIIDSLNTNQLISEIPRAAAQM